MFCNGCISSCGGERAAAALGHGEEKLLFFRGKVQSFSLSQWAGGQGLLRPVWLLLVPKANGDKAGAMRKRPRPIESLPDLCSANKRSLCKTTEGAARVFLRAWLWGRYQTKGSHLAQGRMCRFHPKAAGASLANNALRYPGDRLGRRREQLIGMGLPDKRLYPVGRSCWRFPCCWLQTCKCRGPGPPQIS